MADVETFSNLSKKRNLKTVLIGKMEVKKLIKQTKGMIDAILLGISPNVHKAESRNPY